MTLSKRHSGLTPWKSSQKPGVHGDLYEDSPPKSKHELQRIRRRLQPELAVRQRVSVR